MQAVRSVTLELHRGEVLGLIGPNGAGKSTLVNLLSGFDRPTAGTIELGGRDVTRWTPHRRGRHGLARTFQHSHAFRSLTVRENVEFGMKMKGVGKREREVKAREYLRLIHLSKFEDSYTHQLSGGMRQRVAIARALATEPDVLLMDEPFAALDAQTRDLLHDELERIWSETGCTIVFVTHNVREAVRLADRVVLLTFRPGQIKGEFGIALPRPGTPWT